VLHKVPGFAKPALPSGSAGAMPIRIVPLMLPVVELKLQKERRLGCRSFWSVTGALAAVHVQDLASDERGVFQKHDRVDDV
jgi:hypothetical protein